MSLNSVGASMLFILSLIVFIYMLTLSFHTNDNAIDQESMEISGIEVKEDLTRFFVFSQVMPAQQNTVNKCVMDNQIVDEGTINSDTICVLE